MRTSAYTYFSTYGGEDPPVLKTLVSLSMALDTGGTVAGFALNYLVSSSCGLGTWDLDLDAFEHELTLCRCSIQSPTGVHSLASTDLVIFLTDSLQEISMLLDPRRGPSR